MNELKKISTTKILLKNQVRIYVSDYSTIVDDILKMHKDFLPLPKLIIANAIVAFTPLNFLYNSNALSLKMDTLGPIKTLMIEIKDDNVRALLANANIETEYDKKNINDVPLILGIGDGGTLSVNKIINGETFSSKTPLARADIVTDIAYYLNNSDQIFSAVINDVELKTSNKIAKAKNVIFQLLPDHTEEDIKWIENFIQENDFKKMDVDQYIKKMDAVFYLEKEMKSNCWCTKEKLLSAISFLSIAEKEEIFDNDDKIFSKCDFCNKNYKIYKRDL